MASANNDGDLGFQVAPMVDVVFVLMLFFMATAGMQITELELGVNLPGGKPQGESLVATIVVDVGADGVVVANNAICGAAGDKDLNALRHVFATVVEFGNEDQVIVRPHMDASHERIMEVLNAAGAAGGKNLTFN